MTREEAITYLKVIWNRYKAEYEIERETLDAYHMAIEALTEPINCVKCKHYYETEDDTDVHGHCRIDTAHTNLISRADALRELNGACSNWKDDCKVAEIINALPSADAVQGEWGHMMIDGNKLMLALSEWWYSSFGLEETEESKAIHKVMDEVERYVDHEKSADYWIPCSERLPNEGGFYLCTTEDCVTILEFVTGNYHYNESPSFVSDTLGRCNGYVIAWMPLPKPYREDGEQE